MNIDLTRRSLLHLAGASSLAMAAAAAARAEGNAEGGGPTFASRTPMRVGMVTMRVRQLDPIADFYRDVIGLTVMERTASGALLGSGGVRLLALEANPKAGSESRNAAGLYHTAFLMPTRKDPRALAGPCGDQPRAVVGLCRSPRQRIRLSRRSRRQWH